MAPSGETALPAAALPAPAAAPAPSHGSREAGARKTGPGPTGGSPQSPAPRAQTAPSLIWSGASAVAGVSLKLPRGDAVALFEIRRQIPGGSVAQMGGVVMQRNWAAVIYPWLERKQLVETVGNTLSLLSRPFNPLIVWEMNPLKFPVNSYEIYFLAIVFSIICYCTVSFLTCKKPFNLERMLHRGIYAIDEEKPRSAWTWKNFYGKFIGITPEYSRGDKWIAWGVFAYTICYRFLGTFVLVVIWNAVSPWPVARWGTYFLWIHLIVPAFLAVFSTVWFGAGGFRDLRNFFRSLRTRTADHLDNGVVDGEVSLMDRKKFSEIESAKKETPPTDR